MAPIHRVFFLLSRRHHTQTLPSLRTIDKLLIANRGEIACRIMRTARKMGIGTVAVYSDPDRNSLHVSEADEAFHIGAAASAESYLKMDRIIQVAKAAGADAIHPGYGFLSENTNFADMCAKEGILFVGPPSSAIRDMGIKNTAKQIMHDAGVPVVMGYHGSEQSDETLRAQSLKIGYPVMLKAVYGGGGKGMRIARSDSEFSSQLESARREAMKSFGNDEMLVEKFVENPRHVEVQVFGDMHGHYVYLFERDCSIQRRHQKIIEEAPAPRIKEESRRFVGEAAVKAAQAVSYVGAGTVEFIMDASENFYFMEMNTRLQVEHPVSEMITDTDLVEWQLRVAQGEPLPICDQREIGMNGHSLEARLYAEDPENAFMPGAGHLSHLRFTDPVPSYLRVETGVTEGDDVSVHYDPMIAKVVVWAPDRHAAIRRLDRVLSQTHVVGLKTNVDFLRAVLSHPEFIAGNVYTDFIPDHEKELFPPAEALPFHIVVEAVAAYLFKNLTDTMHEPNFNPNDPFSGLDSFRVNLEHGQKLEFEYKGEKLKIEVVTHRDGSHTVTHNNQSGRVAFNLLNADDSDIKTAEFEVDDGERLRKVKAVWSGQTLDLFTLDGQFELLLPAPKWVQESGGGAVAGGGSVAPMPGVVEKVMVNAGDTVEKGDALVVMVAMKMEYVIKAPHPGTIDQVLCKPGDNVNKNASLVTFQADQEPGHTEDAEKVI